MNEDILSQIKKEYKEKIEEQEKVKKQYDRLLELENNEIVNEYMSLKEKFSKININKLLEATDDDIIRFSYTKYLNLIKETNKIYVYLGAYSDNIERDILHGTTDYRVKIDDPSACYVLCKDLENNEIIKVDIKKYKEFKVNNNIIIPNRYLTEQYHYELQQNFYKDCIKGNQENAVKRIICKKR